MALNGRKIEPMARKVRGLRLGLCLLVVLGLCLGTSLSSAAEASRLSRQNTNGELSATKPGTGNTEALMARLDSLKSEGRYLEAASVLKQALGTMAEGRSKAGLQVMEARFLGWGKDYDGAIDAYGAVLREYPSMTEARKGLASVLGWKGSYDEAITEYKKILEQNPADSSARLGLARVLAWKGDYKGSVAVYREVLSSETSNQEARIGLGRTLWWSGDRGGAYKELGEVLDAEPDNSEARALRQKIRLATGPQLSLDFIVSDDSDSNHLEIYRAGGYYSPVKGLKLNLVFSQFEASRFSDRARAKSLGLRGSYRLAKKTTLSSRIAWLSLDTPSNPTSELTGGLSVRQVLPGGFRAGAGVSHYVLLDTAQLIRNNIRVDEFSAYLAGKVYTVDFTTGIRYGDYSDGNNRKDFFIDISRSFEYYGIVFTGGYRLDYRDFSENLNSGYFDPADFFSHIFYGRARGSLYGGRIEYDAYAGGGVQSFNTTSESTTEFYLDVKGHLTKHLIIRGRAKYARSALASASGFRYEEYRAGLDYLF